ncbi:MAG TPA: histone deacetylase family protein, partial [Burkholderiaceae bacterium]|nr:histone deacetylase family protein [Burkholderiaceae bacterium]
MTTAFYSHPECRGHDMGRGHPECPQRLDAIDDYLLASGVDVALQRREAPLVDFAEVANAHASGYIAALRDFLVEVQDGDVPLRSIDPDTAACPGTW